MKFLSFNPIKDVKRNIGIIFFIFVVFSRNLFTLWAKYTLIDDIINDYLNNKNTLVDFKSVYIICRLQGYKIGRRVGEVYISPHVTSPCVWFKGKVSLKLFHLMLSILFKCNPVSKAQKSKGLNFFEKLRQLQMIIQQHIKS